MSHGFLPSSLEAVSAEATYTDPDGGLWRAAYICPDPDLTGSAVDDDE